MTKPDRYILTLLILEGPMPSYDAGQIPGRLGRLQALYEQRFVSYDGTTWEITMHGREAYSRAASS